MPEWLREAIAINNEVSPESVIIRLWSAFLMGLAVAYIGRKARGPGSDLVPGFATTLVLLTVLVAMVTVVIGNSVARAFGLVGALSIIRFRTSVEDTRDTAFVIFAVSVGMAVGAGFFLASLVSVPVVGVCSFILRRYLNPPGLFGTLTVRLKSGIDSSVIEPIVHRFLAGGRIVCVSAKKGGDTEIRFKGSLSAELDPIKMLTEINGLEGVQGEEWNVG